MNAPDLREVLQRAQQSITAAISCIDKDREAAIDDMVAARLLVCTALLTLQQETGHIG